MLAEDRCVLAGKGSVMSWEAGEEAEGGFVGAPGEVGHESANWREPPVLLSLRFLILRGSCQ